MPIERILSEDDIDKVIKANGKPPFAIRNKAIVLVLYDIGSLNRSRILLCKASGGRLCSWATAGKNTT